jgi:DNA-binding CsgD family transcriptional regulator
MEEFGAISDLIGALYDAASGIASFEPIAGQIAGAFGSQSCNIQVRNGFAGPCERVTFTGNYTPEMIQSYNQHYYQHDVWVNLAMRHPNERILGSDDLILDAEYRETLIHREYSRHMGIFYLMGGRVSLGGPDGAFGVLGIHHSEQEGLFSPEEKRRGALLLPHLQRALQLRERLGQMDIQQQAMFQAMETISLGVLLAAEDGRVLFANHAGEEILRHAFGLREHGGRLQATYPGANAELQNHIRSAARASLGRSSDAGGLLRLPRAGHNPLSLSIYPFMAPHLSNGGTVPAALVFVSAPEQQVTPSRDALAQMYRLTGAEARLFEALLVGERLQDYAERSSLSLQTVKTQLARLFDKTGHARQTDLVRDALSDRILSLKCF